MYVAQERRAYILRLLEQRGSLRSSELAQELGVTDETIRTDLVAMQRQGLLQRIHGGARHIPPGGGEEDATRLDCQLADLAAARISPGMRVYMQDAAFAEVLLGRHPQLPCSICTPNPALLLALARPTLTQPLACPAGTLDRESALLDTDAPAWLAAHAPDLAILCPPAVTAPGHTAYPTRLQARWAAAASRAAAKTLIAGPAAIFHAAAPHPAQAFRATYLTENNLPPAFSRSRAETVPYISAADLQQDNRFDY